MNSCLKEIEILKSEVDSSLHHHLDFVRDKLLEKKTKNNEYSKMYYQKNNEQLREYHREYVKKNPYKMNDEQKQKYREYQKQYYSTYRKKNNNQTINVTNVTNVNEQTK